MNFEEIGKKVKKFSKETVSEVQKMNEVRQLNIKVSDEKKILNTLYLEMGQKLYDCYKEQPLEKFEEEFQKIDECFKNIDLLQDQIRNVKGVVLCSCCNMEVSATEKFCSNCGNRMPDVITIEEKTENDDAIVVDSEVVEPETVQEDATAGEADAETVQEDAAVSEADAEAVQEDAAAGEAAAEAVQEDAVSEADAETVQEDAAAGEADAEAVQEADAKAVQEDAEKEADAETV